MSTGESPTAGGFNIRRRKRWPWIAGAVALVVIVAGVIVGISQKGSSNAATLFGPTLKIGYATSTPAEKAVIEYIDKEIAPDYGIHLKAIGYGDGDTLYRAVDEHKIAGQFSAHRYWTAEVNDRLGTHNFATDAEVFTWVGSVYSAKYHKLTDIPDGAKVSVPQEPSVQAQQLEVIANLGFIKLNPKVDPLFVTLKDVVSNPHHWKLTPIGLDSQARVYKDFDVTFGGGEGVDPKALIENVPLPRPYSPPLTIAEDTRTNPWIVKLYKAFKDPRIQTWLKSSDGQRYKTVIAPVPTEQPVAHPELYPPLDPASPTPSPDASYEPQPSASASGK